MRRKHFLMCISTFTSLCMAGSAMAQQKVEFTPPTQARGDAQLQSATGQGRPAKNVSGKADMNKALTGKQFNKSTVPGALPRGGGIAGGPQADDSCANAPTVGDGTYDYNLAGATNDYNNPALCGGTTSAADVWFRYVPTNSGTATASTCGLTTGDSVLAVLDECGGTILVCLDDFCGLQTQISFAVNAGEDYYVRIAGFGGGIHAGQVRLAVAGGGGGGNDECANATSIGDGIHDFDNTAATGSDITSCTFNDTLDVWFSYTASSTGTMFVETCGLSFFDTALALFDSCGGAELACNDDNCGLQSRVTLAVTQGQIIKIRVAGYNGQAGVGQFEVGVQQPCTTVQCPGNSVPEGEDCGSDANGGCNSLPPVYGTIPCGGTVCGTIWASGGTRDTDWYSFTLCVESTVTWEVTSEAPAVLFLLNSDCNAITLLAQGEAPACGTGSASTVLPPGQYVAFIATGALAGGIFDGFPCGTDNDYYGTLTYDCTVLDQGRCCLPDGNCVETNAAGCAQQGGDFLACATCAGSPCPAGNDLCEDAIPIGDGIHDFSNIGAAQDGPSNCGAMGSDVFFCYTASCTGRAFVTTCNLTGLDTVLSAYDGCTCFGNLLICVDDSCGFQTRIEFPVVQGQQYLIQLGGFGGQQGSGQFEIGCFQPCQLVCPPGAIQEGENCGDDTNGGCNAAGEPVTALQCGQTVCGTAWASGGTRDTDWYEFRVCVQSDVTWTVESEIGMAIFLLDANCPPAILAIGEVFGCQGPGSVTLNLTPGVYRAFAAPSTFDGFPCGPDNDYIGTLTYDCSVVDNGACCLPGGGCQDVANAAACAALGGTFTQCANCSQVFCPCSLTCPPGAAQEGEDCGSDTNGGCNSVPPIFGTIACGSSVCGTAWASGGTRDTDWYDFTLAGPALVSVSVEAELPVVTFLLDGNCPPAILAIGGTPACGAPVPASFALGAGSYRVFVATGLPSGGGIFDGFPCDGVNNDYIVTLSCGVLGACCLPGGDCAVLIETDCAARGGEYQGEGTDCGGFNYTQSDCNNAFEDISGSGALGCVGDDCATDTAIGFDFNYFGSLYSTVSVGSNGHLRFGAGATRFGNGAIPFADGYDNIICPLWDDWRTDSGGSLYTETRGTAPNRRFIAQWQGVTHFSGPEVATFQAILFEGTNCIEFRYNGWGLNSPTIGIENSNGTAGISVDPNTVAQDDCIQFCGESTGNPCEDECAGFLLGDSDGSGAVNNFDIDAFVLAISNPPAYIAQFCGGDPQCHVCRNDLDHSGLVNNFDIDPFVNCLNNLPLPGQPCP